MMQSMRDNMKIIIWLTAIAFLVGFGILQLGGVLNPPQSSGPTGVIAKINGEPVRYEEFMRVYQADLAELRKSRELNQGEDSYVREQVWQQMIQAKLMTQEIKRRGITVTPDEIKTSIRMAPPQFILEVPGFQTDGNFDYRKYLAELDNPKSQVPWDQVEAYVAVALPQQKLQDAIVAAAKISEADVRERFLRGKEQLRVRYLHFPIDSFPVDTSRIGGADIETYYRSHPDEFTGPAEVRLQVGLVRRLPRDADFSAAMERMRGLRSEILAQPDSFEMYARMYSEILSAQGGGKAPEIPYASMRPPFQAVVKTLQPGQISEIAREERSLHLFRLDGRRQDATTKQIYITYHEIAIRVEPGPETIREIRKEVDGLMAEARKDGLTKACTRRGIATRETEFFSEGKSGNSVFQRFPETETWAFTAKVGAVSRPVPHENGWYVYQILERLPAGLRPLGQARIFTRERLIRSLQVARAMDAAAQARAAILAGASEADAAKRFHGAIGTAEGTTRAGTIVGIGAEPKVVGALFVTPVGVWTQALEGTTGGFLGLVEEHTRPTEEEFKAEMLQLRNSMITERRQALFNEWLKQRRREAKIEDYRENFFEV